MKSPSVRCRNLKNVTIATHHEAQGHVKLSQCHAKTNPCARPYSDKTELAMLSLHGNKSDKYQPL